MLMPLSSHYTREPHRCTEIFACPTDEDGSRRAALAWRNRSIRHVRQSPRIGVGVAAEAAGAKDRTGRRARAFGDRDRAAAPAAAAIPARVTAGLAGAGRRADAPDADRTNRASSGGRRR